MAKTTDMDNENKDYFTYEEIVDILNSVRSNFFHSVWIKLIYSLGVTVSDIISLKAKDIDLEKKVIILSGNTRLRVRKLMIPKAIYWDLRLLACHKKPEEYVFIGRNGKIHPRTIQKTFEKFEVTTGYKVNISKLRRTVAIHLYGKGWKIQAISDFLGHQNQKSTRLMLKKFCRNGKKGLNPPGEIEGNQES